MKVRALTGFIYERGRAVNLGDVVEMDEARARIKIAAGQVVAVEEGAAEVVGPESAATETRDVQPDNRDPNASHRDPLRVSRRSRER